MRLRHIEVFNAVMLTGSVSAAARLINVTQPAVSRILAHAELQLGFPLFHRLKGRLPHSALAPLAAEATLAARPNVDRLLLTTPPTTPVTGLMIAINVGRSTIARNKSST